jgi:glutaredoxin
MLDYLSIFKTFNQKKINYVVVGGLAVNFHGIPRMTYDIDILLSLEEKNLIKFLRLMKSWGFKPRMPVDILDFANANKRRDWIKNKNMKAFNMVNPDWAITEIDVIIDSPVDYDKAVKKVYHSVLGSIKVPTISIDDLILMKSCTGRSHDKDDIKNLKKIKNEK